jgi:hypothetical protein
MKWTAGSLPAGAALLLTLAFAAPSHADVIRVDMQPSPGFDGRTSVNFTGPESSATAANPIFGSDGANAWNYLNITTGTATDPSFSNLANSEGVATGVSIAFTGTVGAANDNPLFSGSEGVENDYFLICGSGCGNVSSSVTYTISGLPVSTLVALYLYSPSFTQNDSSDPTDQPNRGYTLTANGTSVNVPSGSGSENALLYITTDASGDIAGTWSVPDGNEGDWSGFQIGYPIASSATPLPAALPLFGSGLGLLGLIASRRKRRQSAA